MRVTFYFHCLQTLVRVVVVGAIHRASRGTHSLSRRPQRRSSRCGSERCHRFKLSRSRQNWRIPRYGDQIRSSCSSNPSGCWHHDFWIWGANPSNRDSPHGCRTHRPKWITTRSGYSLRSTVWGREPSALLQHGFSNGQTPECRPQQPKGLRVSEPFLGKNEQEPTDHLGRVEDFGAVRHTRLW